MTRLRLELGPDETELLGRLADVNPGYLKLDECDPIALGNLRAIGCAGIGGRRVWVSADGLALWATRMVVDE